MRRLIRAGDAEPGDMVEGREVTGLGKPWSREDGMRVQYAWLEDERLERIVEIKRDIELAREDMKRLSGRMRRKRADEIELLEAELEMRWQAKGSG